VQYGVTCGNLIASFDLNSDRINMVIVDDDGKIRDVKVKHPEVTSHGFPKNKAIKFYQKHNGTSG